MAVTQALKINVGIEEKDRKEIADGLSHLLADTYTLYLKTQKFHWNVTGPMFQTLHLMFEEEYNELAIATDTIAERIRALGFPAPASYNEFTRLASIHEESGVPEALDMVSILVEGHEVVIRTARKLVPLVERVHDETSIDLLTHRMKIHEKTAWMLRSLLS